MPDVKLARVPLAETRATLAANGRVIHIVQESESRSLAPQITTCKGRWCINNAAPCLSFAALLNSHHGEVYKAHIVFDICLNDWSSINNNVKMSCDFGPIPLPTSPLQTYWEEQYFSHNSTANQSRSAPVTKPEKGNFAPDLMTALEKLAEEQRQEEEDKLEHVPQIQPAPREATAHRRQSSFGGRLLSSVWTSLAGEQTSVQAQKMKQL